MSAPSPSTLWPELVGSACFSLYFSLVESRMSLSFLWTPNIFILFFQCFLLGQLHILSLSSFRACGNVMWWLNSQLIRSRETQGETQDFLAIPAVPLRHDIFSLINSTPSQLWVTIWIPKHHLEKSLDTAEFLFLSGSVWHCSCIQLKLSQKPQKTWIVPLFST